MGVLRLTRDGVELASVPVSMGVVNEPRPVPAGYTLIEGQTISGELKLTGKSRLAYRGCNFGQLYIDQGSHHIWVDAGGGKYGEGGDTWSKLFVASATDVELYGFQIDGGGRYQSSGNQIKVKAAGAPDPDRVRLEDFEIRNFRKDPATSDHVDGLHIMAGRDSVLRRGRFRNNEHFHVLYTRYLSTTPTGWLVEDMEWGSVGLGYYTLSLGGGHSEQYSDITVQRCKRIDGEVKGMNAGPAATFSNVVFKGNASKVSGCGISGVTCSGNTG